MADDGAMSATRLVRSPTLAAAPYAYAACVAPGSTLHFLAGACPLDVEGETVAPGDVTAQTAQALGNVRQALADAGAALTDVVFLRVLVASDRRDDLVQAWQEVRRAFGDHDPPGTLQGVTVLGYPDQLVEVEVVAAT